MNESKVESPKSKVENRATGQAGGPAATGAPPPVTPVAPADLSVRDLRRMTKDDLAALARSAGLAEDGSKADLLDRLLAAKRGGAERHVHGGTICPMCRKVTMRVTSTSDTKRYMKCDACGYRRTFARTA